MDMPPEQSAAQQSAPEDPQGASSGGVGKLIGSIHSGLSQLMQVFQSSPVPDQFKQQLDSIGQAFTMLIQEMNKPADQPDPDAAAEGESEASGPVGMEAGANTSVKPVM